MLNFIFYLFIFLIIDVFPNYGIRHRIRPRHNFGSIILFDVSFSFIPYRRLVKNVFTSLPISGKRQSHWRHVLLPTLLCWIEIICMRCENGVLQICEATARFKINLICFSHFKKKKNKFYCNVTTSMFVIKCSRCILTSQRANLTIEIPFLLHV